MEERDGGGVTAMTARAISVLIGYFCGCFITAEAVAKRFAGKSASEVGETGNPGMANIMAALGFWPGLITLAGDLIKCFAAAFISYMLFARSGAAFLDGAGAAGSSAVPLLSGGAADNGRIVMLYAALGATLGHDFPFWRGFRGGKGVTTTSAGIVVYSPLWGLLANIAGMFTVFATKYLCIGGPVIPLLFSAAMVLTGRYEAAVLGAALTALSLRAHFRAIMGIRSGKTGKTDVIGAVRKKSAH